MNWIKKIFKNKDEASAEDPRIDADFLNEFQDSVIEAQTELKRDKIATEIKTSDGTTVQIKLDDLEAFMNTYRQTIHRVGDIIQSYNPENPSIRYGGRWQLTAVGRKVVGYDKNQVEFNAVRKMGGEKTHKLTIEEIPSHEHRLDGVNTGASAPGQAGSYPARIHQDTRANWGVNSMYKAGGDKEHNNLDPYIVAYIWEKVA